MLHHAMQCRVTLVGKHSFKNHKKKKMSFSNLDIDILGCPLSLVMLIGLATIVPASLVVAI